MKIVDYISPFKDFETKRDYKFFSLVNTDEYTIFANEVCARFNMNGKEFSIIENIIIQEFKKENNIV